MKKALDILPECYVDTNLIGWLLGEGVNHHYGCGSVTSLMQKGKLSDVFAVGIVDDDKWKSKYINEFNSLAKSDHLEILKHPGKYHYFILIKKAAENFIISAADELGYNLADSKLSNDLEELKKITKDNQSNENKELRKAFDAIKKASEMKILRNLLKYLEIHKYDADESVIRNIFAVPNYNIW